MALITECTFCGEQLVNASICDECRIAELEILLSAFRDVLSVNNGLREFFPSDVVEKILGEEPAVKSKEDFLRMKNERRIRQMEKDMWESSLREHMRLAADKFRQEHPDPKPDLY